MPTTPKVPRPRTAPRKTPGAQGSGLETERSETPGPDASEPETTPMYELATPDAGARKVFRLDDNLDLLAATELAKGLRALRGADLRVDASGVRHLGAQSAQVLASASATWTADGTSFAIVAGSPEFHEGLRLLGMDTILAEEERVQ